MSCLWCCFCLCFCGTAALVQRNGPVRLTARIRFQSSSVVSSSGAKLAMPALLMSASSRPKRCASASMAAFTAPASETSQHSAIASSGRPSAVTASASCLSSMSSSATRQPSFRNRVAVARPIPRAAPVTRATFGRAADMNDSGSSGIVGQWSYASAPANTRLFCNTRHQTQTSAVSRRICVRVLPIDRPRSYRGRREGRMLGQHPWPACNKKHAAEPQVRPNTGLPCARV